MDVKQSKEFRGLFGREVSEIEIEGFEYKGTTKEGLAFSNGTDVLVVKLTIKKAGFDLEAALVEKADAEDKADERKNKTSVEGRKTKAINKGKTMTKADVDEMLDELMNKNNS